jgi:hypothetical protein
LSDEEQEQQRNDIIQIVKLRLRFIPGNTNEELLLRDDVPHCEVTKRIRGGWGSFAADL